MREKAENVDAYIAGYPPEVQKLLEQMRSTIKKVAPKAVEAISYAIPGYKLNGPLVYFAGYSSVAAKKVSGPAALIKYKQRTVSTTRNDPETAPIEPAISRGLLPVFKPSAAMNTAIAATT